MRYLVIIEQAESNRACPADRPYEDLAAHRQAASGLRFSSPSLQAL